MTTTAVMNTYGRIPVAFTHGNGVYLYDQDGNEYLDAISGIGVNALGHNHEKVTAAITSQAERLIHTSNLYGIENQTSLAEILCKVSGMDSVFFGNSGAEANEAAIKIARLYGHNKGIDVPQIVVMENAFHGRTMATLTASGNRKIQAGFEPLLGGFIRAPFGDIEALRNIASNNSNIVAVLAEPIQGEGGVNTPPDGYIAALREVCDQHDWLLMLDEVQTGNGRTGQYFAYQHAGITPDVVATAKGLANGLPIGACLAHGKAATVLGPGNHGSTYGGNPLVCAAALVVVNTIGDEKLDANAATQGQLIRTLLTEGLKELDAVVDIRGQGLLIGVELDRPCAELVDAARAKGILINVASGNVVRLLPPLVIDSNHAERIAATVVEIISTFAPNQ